MEGHEKNFVETHFRRAPVFGVLLVLVGSVVAAYFQILGEDAIKVLGLLSLYSIYSLGRSFEKIDFSKLLEKLNQLKEGEEKTIITTKPLFKEMKFSSSFFYFRKGTSETYRCEDGVLLKVRAIEIGV